MVENLGVFDQILAGLLAGGDGWHLGEMTYSPHNAPAGNHFAYTWLDVAGPGILTVFNTSSSGVDVGVQVDGGSIYNVADSHCRSGAKLMIPFKTSLKVSSSVATSLTNQVFAVLGEVQWSDMVLIGSQLLTHDATTTLDLQGVSGVMTAVSFPDGYVTFETDSSGQIFKIANTANQETVPMLVPFKNRLLVKTSSATPPKLTILLD